MNTIRLFVLLLTPLIVSCGYEIKYLGTLGGATSSANDINRHNQIVGSSETETGETHAVFWQGDTKIDLGTLGGSNSWAYAINDSGAVVGVSETADGVRHAFLWQNGTMTDIHGSDRIDDSSARAINNSGLIVGQIGIDGALWRSLVEIESVNGGRPGPSDAHDINDAVQVVGWYHPADEAFIWEAGTFELLSHLGVNRTRAYGINNLGQVAGDIILPGGNSHVATVWQGRDPPIVLGSLGGSYCTAKDINDSGLAFGLAENSDGSMVPFYFNLSAGVMYELPNFGGGRAHAVNNRGFIVGQATDSAGNEQAVIWEY